MAIYFLMVFIHLIILKKDFKKKWQANNFSGNSSVRCTAKVFKKETSAAAAAAECSLFKSLKASSTPVGGHLEP